MNCIIYGTQAALIKKRLSKVLDDIVGTVNDFNTVYFDYPNTLLDTIVQETQTGAFGCEHKAIVIEHPTFLLDAKGNAQVLETLTALMTQPNNPVSLVFVLEVTEKNLKDGVFKRNDAKLNAFLKQVTQFPVTEIGRNEWPTVVRRLFDNRGLTISDAALLLLLERCGHDLTAIISEINKLGTYAQHIEVEDVEALVATPLEDNVFLIADALVRKKPDVAVNALHDLYTQNTEPISLISIITSQLHFMYQVKYLTGQGKNTSEIAQLLDHANYNRVSIVQNEIYYITENELLHLLERLADLDYQIKSGQVDRFMGLELLCCECLRGKDLRT